MEFRIIPCLLWKGGKDHILPLNIHINNAVSWKHKFENIQNIKKLDLKRFMKQYQCSINFKILIPNLILLHAVKKLRVNFIRFYISNVSSCRDWQMNRHSLLTWVNIIHYYCLAVLPFSGIFILCNLCFFCFAFPILGPKITGKIGYLMASLMAKQHRLVRMRKRREKKKKRERERERKEERERERKKVREREKGEGEGEGE